jgi:purine-nucleoside phosphorylase
LDFVKTSSAPDVPLLRDKDYNAPSVFRAENLLREARRQKNVPDGTVPEICVLDPDGDLVRHLLKSGMGHKSPVWACYHTDLVDFESGGTSFGVVGCAVGASFAVLIAEQMFASGCRLLISITSSGQIADGGATPYFILIDRALRDEGTSHHYLAPSDFSDADPALVRLAQAALDTTGLRVITGPTWTTDAPYRETETAIAGARAQGVLAVEMEAAALYAFATACARPVLCVAHVTNQMAQIEGDFEKGEAGGAHDAIRLLEAVATAWNDKENLS